MCVASLYYVVAELSEKVNFYINYFSDTLGWYGGSASRPAPGGVGGPDQMTWNPGMIICFQKFPAPYNNSVKNIDKFCCFPVSIG